MTRNKLPAHVTGAWTLADLRAGKLGAPRHNLKAFSCFHCGGGSTMGLKLAGFDVVGGVEIDPKMMATYRKNFEPRHSYLMGVQEFHGMPNSDLPPELFKIDVLDGSPPCSSFSISGDREKSWGREKMFKEGQAKQVLDDLFFQFIEVARKLRPKVVIAENVKGLVMGHARSYVKDIFAQFRSAGYETQLFLMNASRMGVPQTRERVFFIGRRDDLKMPPLEPDFNEPVIPIGRALEGCARGVPKVPNEKMQGYWRRTPPGKSFADLGPEFERKGWGSYFNWNKLNPKTPCRTLPGNSDPLLHWAECRSLFASELVRLQSFPDDYDFCGQKAGYMCGMSVPPLMMQRIALEVARALLSRSIRR